MTDEVSVSFHISILVMCTAALLSAVIGISTMSLHLMRNYSFKYNEAINQASEGGIYALAQTGEAPMPVIYTTVSESINTIDKIVVKDKDGTHVVYKYNDVHTQNITVLLSKYRLYTGTVSLVPGELNRSLQTLYVEVKY